MSDKEIPFLEDSEQKEKEIINDQNSIDNIDMSKIFNSKYESTKESEKYFKEHFINVKNIEALFKTDFQNGLNSNDKEDLARRETKWGNNHPLPEKKNSILEHILNSLEDPTLRVLLYASITALIFGVVKTGWIEGIVIFFTLSLVCAISSYINYQETEEFLKLRSETGMKKVVVIRDGLEKEISIEDILVGDILKFRMGEIINVDGFVLPDCKVGMDESHITGESKVKWKGEEFEIRGSDRYQCPFCFSGSQIIDGYGSMVVATVGEKTFEKSNKKLSTEQNGKGEDETPLKKQLNELMNKISNTGYVIAILIGCVFFIKEVILKINAGVPFFSSITLDIAVNALIIVVVLIVVSTPEGLPLSVTIALAFSANKMKKEQILVKNLDKLEEMGNINNICTEKTGTLTLGELQAIRFYIFGKDKEAKNIIDDNERKIIRECLLYNKDCKERFDEEGKKILLGDMNEKALYNYLEKNDYDLIIPKTKEKPIETLPFKSEYKYRMNLYENGDNYILYVKGDQQRVSQFFTKFLVEDREEEYSEHENDLLDQCAAYAQDSMRTVVCGQKIVTKEEFDTLNKKYYFEKELGFFREMANGLTFTFMVGIRDNYREDVPDAILNCHKAGITVRMVTGDNINSSIAISKDTHIISPEQAEEALTLAKDYKKLLYKNEEKLDDLLRDVKDARSPIAIEGEVFRKVCGGITKIDKGNGEMDIFLVDEEAFAHVTKRLRIIARASPEDKFLLVFGLKELGNIIAVTGEDKGDVPAVKQAHVGFVMGIKGIDKTKEAADILLLNDNFSSIVRAYEFGRNIHDCIKKFIQFQLTTYIVLIFMIFLGSLLLKDSPLNTIQLLWINLIMNSFASLLLTTEDPTDKLFARKPYSRDGSFLTTMIKTHIISQSIFQIIILTVILFFGDIVFGVPSDRELEHFMWNNVNGYHFTIFFNIFVYLQVFNLFNSRKLLKDEYNVFDGIDSNLNYYLIQIIIILLVQWILVSFGGSVVRTKYLTISQHLLCLGISALSLLWDFIVKRLPIDIEDDSVVHDEDEKDKIKEGEDALL